MPSYTEPHNFFNEDLFQGTSIIDLLQNSPDVNLPCYMSDEEPLALPLMLPSSSDLSLTGSVNVLDMINQDVMLGSMQSTSNADTEVTYVTQGTAPTAAPFTSGDVFLPSASDSTADTFVKPFHSHFSSQPMDRTSQPILTLSPMTNTNSIMTQSTNPFEVNPFVATQNQMVRNPFAATSNTNYEVDRNSPKTPSSSNRKSKGKSHSSHKSSKVVKKISRTSSKQSIFVISSSQKVNLRTRSDVKATVTHTVTRTTDVVVECTQTVAATTHTVPTIADNTGAPCTVVGVVSTTVSQTVSCTAVDTTGTVAATSSDVSPSYAFAKARAPSTVVAPMQNAFVPRKVLYSTPVISRVPSVPAADRVCDRFTMLPGQGTCASGGCGKGVTGQAPRPRTRLVIPMSLNTFATSVASGVTTTATVANRHHSVQAVRPLQCPHSLHTGMAHTTPATTASTVAPRALTHSSFAFPPGATLYAAKKIKSNSQTLTTEPQTFAIVDSKGTYTTLTISPDFTTTTASPLVMTQTQTTTAGTAGACTTSPGPSDSGAKSRSQFLIPLANSQINTNSGIGYLVTSPIGSGVVSRSSPTAQATRSNVPTATTIASHTITTISSEALNRLRSRLMCNVPSTAAGLSLPPSTISLDGNKPRGPVTIIANQLISAVNPRERVANAVASGVAPRTILSTASQGLYTISAPVATNMPSRNPTETATRPINRVVIPINVHANATSHSAVSTQGTYFITGVNHSLATAGDPVTRPSRVVIPIIHNTSATAAPNPTLTVSPAGSVVPPPVGSIDPQSKLRNRLTIQVSTIESIIPGTTTPITAYTIARTRPPQSAYSLPGSSYMSSTKASDGTRNPATMTLITFAPSTSGVATAGCPQKSPTVPRGDITSPALTTAIPTLASTGNRYVIKLAGASAMGPGTTSTVTPSITTPITTSAIIQEHHFTEPHPVATRFRAVPAPRTYSIAQRSPQPPVTRHINPRFKKVITSPSPLQIFADVVCPPSTGTTPTTATQSLPRTRFTLSHTPGTSTLVVPQYKNTIFRNLSTVARPERMSARFMGPRAPSERFVLNRSVALVTPRRTTIFSPTQSQREFRTQRVEPTFSMSQASPAVSDTDQLPVGESIPSNDEDDYDML